MSNKPEQPKPAREFWIMSRPEGDIIYKHDNKHKDFIHVIEKSAYDQLASELEALKLRPIAVINDPVTEKFLASNAYLDEIKRLRAECERARTATDYSAYERLNFELYEARKEIERLKELRENTERRMLQSTSKTTPSPKSLNGRMK